MSNLENLLSVGRISPQCVLAPYFGESYISRYILSNWDNLLSDVKRPFWAIMIWLKSRIYILVHLGLHLYLSYSSSIIYQNLYLFQSILFILKMLLHMYYVQQAVTSCRAFFEAVLIKNNFSKRVC